MEFQATREQLDIITATEGFQRCAAELMFTNNPSGSKPVFSYHKSEKEEACWIAETIIDSINTVRKIQFRARLKKINSV